MTFPFLLQQLLNWVLAWLLQNKLTTFCTPFHSSRKQTMMKETEEPDLGVRENYSSIILWPMQKWLPFQEFLKVILESWVISLLWKSYFIVFLSSGYGIHQPIRVCSSAILQKLIVKWGSKWSTMKFWKMSKPVVWNASFGQHYHLLHKKTTRELSFPH